MNLVRSSLEKLRVYVEKEQFKGYDPYDTLNLPFDLTRYGKWIPILAIQLQKRSPVNLRPLLGIRKEYNPKAIGLLLHAYSILYQLKPNSGLKQNIDFLFDWLCENYSHGYSGYAWGYNFDWASPTKTLKAFTPSIVVTAFVGKGIFKYYQVTKDKRAVEILRSACDFILNDLARIETSDGISFSYTPIMKDCCFNASMLGAEILAKTYAITGERVLKDLAKAAVDFTLGYQKEDGHWNYSVDLNTQTERKQIDFHQGYILDSLLSFMKHSASKSERYRTALNKGAEFYKNEQFFANGQSKWRLPKAWPVEIHNQAQGIITFSKLSAIKESYLDFAKTVAFWTIQNMQDIQGNFYYRKNRFYTNKIPHMRWSQAWMMLALTQFLSVCKTETIPCTAISQ